MLNISKEQSEPGKRVNLSGSGITQGGLNIKRDSTKEPSFSIPQADPEPPQSLRVGINENESDLLMIANKDNISETPVSIPVSTKDPQKSTGIFGGIFKSSSSDSDEEEGYKSESDKSYKSSYRSDADSEEGGYTKYEEDAEERLTYEQIQQKKAYYLSMFDKLEERGVKIHHKYTMNSELKDLKREYTRIKTQIEMEDSIKFSRRMLMASVWGIEYISKRDVVQKRIDLGLDDWSMAVWEDIDSYDDIFEELYEKYGTGPDMSPEMKLLWTLGSSAVWYSATRRLSGQKKQRGSSSQQEEEYVTQQRMEEYRRQKVLADENRALRDQMSQMQHTLNQLTRQNVPVHPVHPGGRPLDPRPEQSTPTQNSSIRQPSDPSEVLKRLQQRNNELANAQTPSQPPPTPKKIETVSSSSSSSSSSSESSSSGSDSEQEIPEKPIKKRGGATRGRSGRGRGRGRGAV